MSMRSFFRRGGVLRDASGARRASCRIRKWFDHHKLADPFIYPLELSKSFGKCIACAWFMVISIAPLRITQFLQSAIKELIERLTNGVRIVTRLPFQQSFGNQRFNFGFA
jgi:hypothetical protein